MSLAHAEVEKSLKNVVGEMEDIDHSDYLGDGFSATMLGLQGWTFCEYEEFSFLWSKKVGKNWWILRAIGFTIRDMR